MATLPVISGATFGVMHLQGSITSGLHAPLGSEAKRLRAVSNMLLFRLLVSPKPSNMQGQPLRYLRMC
jgi:hypothetical protein